MMGVDHGRTGERGRQAGRERMRRMGVDVRERRQHADLQPPRLAQLSRPATECHKLALDLGGEGAGQFKRVTLAAP